MMIMKALPIDGVLTSDIIENGLDKKLVPVLAKEMCKVWEQKQRGKRPWRSSVAVVERILEMSISKKPSRFFLGVTDRCNVNNRTFPLPPRGRRVTHIIKGMLPNGEVPIHALPLRIWAVNGEINDFLNQIRHKNIVIVGPKHFENFGYKLKLENYTHIEIHSTKAIQRVKKIKKRIEEMHEGLLSGHKDVTYFFIGGSAAMWLVTELHGKLENANLIDVGRAFDPYYFYDPVRKKSPRWMFGFWLNRGNTAWVLDKLRPDKNRVYCLKSVPKM
jgi:hypothetical protein